MLAPEPFLESRGTPLSVFHRCQVLGKQGHEIDLVTYHVGSDPEIQNTTIKRIPNIPFIKSVPIGPSLVKIFLDAFVLLTALYLILGTWKKYDVIHAHEEAALMGVLLSRVTGLSLVYDMHSSMPQQLDNFDFTSSPIVSRLFEWIERLCIREADMIIVICQHLKHTVTQTDPAANVHLIENTPLASEEAEDVPTAANLRRQFDIENRPTVVYTGTFEEYQGIDMVVKSAATVSERVDDFQYVLVGGEPKQIEAMQQLAREMGVEEFIQFTGRRPLEEMPAFREIADVLISPRVSGTNTPLKIYSYLKSGTPVVATDVYSHTQVLSSEVAELTEPTPDAFGEGIARLLEDPNKRHRLAENATRLAETEYSQDVFESKHQTAYRSVGG